MPTGHNAANAHHCQEATSSSTVVEPLDSISFLPTNHATADTLTGEVKLPVIPPVIPLETKDRRRTLVLCFDGTGDQFQNSNSNVVKFVSMLMKEDNDKQVVYYQASP